jgi:hypothetical protein
MKLDENPSSGSRADTCWQKDKHDVGNCHFFFAIYSNASNHWDFEVLRTNRTSECYTCVYNTSGVTI